MHRQHQYLGRGVGGRDRPGRLDAVQALELDVHQGDVGVDPLAQVDGVGPRRDGPDDLEVGVEAQHGGDRLGDDRVIFGDHDLDGSHRARTHPLDHNRPPVHPPHGQRRTVCAGQQAVGYDRDSPASPDGP